MDLFGDWIATKNGMLDTLLAMIESDEVRHAETQNELLAAIDAFLDAGRATSERAASRLRTSLPASSASPPWPARSSTTPRASRLLDILMDGVQSIL